MKKNIFILKYAKNLLLIVSALMFAACSGEDQEDQTFKNKIKVSDKEILLSADGSTIFTLDVTSELDWIVELQSEGDWLQKTEKSSTYVKIKAMPNVGTTERMAHIVISDGVYSETVSVLQKSPSTFGGIRDENGQLPVYVSIPRVTNQSIAISANGQYLVKAMPIFEASVWKTTPTLIDLKAGTETELDPLTGQLNITDVSDNGDMLFNFSGWGDRSFIIKKDGTPVDIPVLPGYGGTYVEGMSSDGRVWVGYGTNSSDFMSHPFKWTDGTISELAQGPADAFGDTLWVGAQAVGCSADGSIVHGVDECLSGLVPAVFWDASGVKGVIGQDIIEVYRPSDWEVYACHVPNMGYKYPMSPNGKYYGGMYLYMNFQAMTPAVYYPMLYNTQTKTSTVFYDFANDRPEIVTVTDEGLACTLMGIILDVNSGAVQNSKDWIIEKYGLTTNHNPIVTRFCTDGKTIFGEIPEVGGSLIGRSNFYIYYPSAD